MRTTMSAVTALAGGLLLTTLVWGAAQATSAPDLKGALGTSGAVTLVKHGGGHGGGWRGGGGGPKVMGGGGGGPKMGRGGGRVHAGPRSGGPRFAKGDGHGDRFAKRHDRGDRFEHRRFAGRDFDRFHHRHRVFRNGVWVWVYSPGYAYNDCWWLRRQALITGSPYWWSRYNYCVGYY
jgi:hypothetical protein